MTPIMEYLHTGKLPKDKDEAMKLRRRSSRYCMLDENMYKKAFSSPLLKYVHEEEAVMILKEVHSENVEGIQDSES